MPVFLHLKEFWKDTHITVIMLVLVRTEWGKGGDPFINFFTFFLLFWNYVKCTSDLKIKTEKSKNI